MNVSGVFSAWQYRESNGHISVLLSDRRHDASTGTWNPDNRFWANIAGTGDVDENGWTPAETYFRGILDAIPGNESGKRPPLVRLEGVEHSRGQKAKDGSTYESGFITFFRAKAVQPAAPAQDTAPAAPAAPVSVPDEGGFMSIPDDVSELPFQ